MTHVPLPPELVQEARTLLHNCRAQWMQKLGKDVADRLPACIEWQSTGKMPQDVPAWLQEMLFDAAMPDVTLNWAVIRSHLTNRTIRFLTRVPALDSSPALRKAIEEHGAIFSHFDPPPGEEATRGKTDWAEVTAYGLAKVLGLDLYEYATEGWARLDGSFALAVPVSKEAK